MIKLIVQRKDSKLRIFYTGPKPANKDKQNVILAVRETLVKLGKGRWIEIMFDWLAEIDPYIPREMYARVLAAIKNSDVVVAEITYPSTGVGLQLALAAQYKVPVLALQADWVEVAPQFAEGASGDEFRIVKYNQTNLEKVLKENLMTLGKERFVKFNFISTPEINAELDRVSEAQGISRSSLLRQIIRDYLSRN